MTTLSAPPSNPPSLEETQVLFKEARYRRRRRWLIGIAIAVGFSVIGGVVISFRGDSVQPVKTGSGGHVTQVGGIISTTSGVVTGGIEPCVGGISSSGTTPPFAAGVVAAVRGSLTSKAIGSDEFRELIPTGPTIRARVQAGGRFRFVLAPGHYVLYLSQSMSQGTTASYWAPIDVRVT